MKVYKEEGGSKGQCGNISESLQYLFEIFSSPKNKDIAVVFHAGTAIKKTEDSEAVVTSGGRVMAVVGLANRIEDAQKTAYDSIKKIHFDSIQYRNDIASRACR